MQTDPENETLADLRKRAGLTQMELAYRAHLSTTTISVHERQGTWPKDNDARAIREVCAAEIAKAGTK